jgi:hypothetical protein
MACLLVALAATACSRGSGTTVHHTYSALIRSDTPTSSITIDGVHLDIDNRVSIETSLGESLGQMDGVPSASQITDLSFPHFAIAGARVALRDGRLFLGANDYGRVAAGDEVRIDQDGVAVNGEARGPLP